MASRTRTLACTPRLLALSLLPALLAALLVPKHASAAVNGYDVITEYATSSPAPNSIISGPDGNIWYTAANGNCDPAGCTGGSEFVKVDPATGVTLNTYRWDPTCYPAELLTGRDGNLWAAAGCANGQPPHYVISQLMRVTTNGTLTPFLLPSAPFNVLLGPGEVINGPDGYLWVVTYRNSIEEVDVNTGTVYAERSLPTAAPLPGGLGYVRIAAGSDGNVWFTDGAANRVGRVSTSGLVTEFSVPTASSGISDITAGPDGNLYFTESSVHQLGRITTGGVVTEFPLPAGASPSRIKVGPDGNLWFSDATASTAELGSMTPSGVVQQVPMPVGTYALNLADGPDGNLWFTEGSLNKIGKVGTRRNAVSVDKTAIGFGAVPTNTTPVTQRVTLNNAGPDSMAAFTPTIANAGDPAGYFTLASDTCHGGAVSAGSSCYADVGFTATGSIGNAAGTLIFKIDPGLATEQSVTVGLTATVVGAACTYTAISTDVAQPQNVGAKVTLSATATCPHPNPLYQFSLRPPDGVFSTVQTFSSASSFVWDTTGARGGTYLVRVWVKDVSSPTTTYDAFDTRTYTLVFPGCSSSSIASDVASPQTVGSTVNFRATSAGCPSPLYQWWVLNPAGAWNIAPGHDFANSSATFAWDTTGLTDGTYQIGVWTKESGSPASYDAYAIVTYTLTVTHCTAINIASSLSSPQATGSSITLTPAAIGCPGAQFRFWIRDAAGVWRIGQDYGVGNTYVWNSSSTPVDTNTAATYLVGVWARQPGSTNAYDAFAFNTFSLMSGTCTVNIAPDKTSPQALGTGATWTATAGGCPNTPLSYQFWVSPPGGTWGIVQPYGSSNTYAWNGASAGTYQVGVWIRQAGSAASYDNFALITFTLTPTSTPQACQSVNVGAMPASPQVVGTSITFMATSVTGCSNPEYRWWVRDTAGHWAMVQDYPVPGNTFSWPNGSLPPGNFLVGVWVRQSGSTASYEAYAFFSYTLSSQGLQLCSAVAMSANAPAPQTIGADITFTANAVGCGTPNYRFWLAPPGLGFGEVQPYGVGNTFLWHTAGLMPGVYQIGVWARQSGSAASYEAYAFITYVIEGGPCTTLALWPTKGSPANTIASQPPEPVGITVTWQASAGGCGSTQYQFYVAAPWSSFNLIASYSTTPSFAWNTAGLPTGNYRIEVLARQQSSASAMEVLAISTYELV